MNFRSPTNAQKLLTASQSVSVSRRTALRGISHLVTQIKVGPNDTGFESRPLRHTASRRGLGPSGYWGSFPEPKGLDREINHPPLSSAENKNGWSYTSTPAIRLHGVVRDNFTVPSLHESQYFLANLYIPLPAHIGSRM